MAQECVPNSAAEIAVLWRPLDISWDARQPLDGSWSLAAASKIFRAAGTSSVPDCGVHFVHGISQKNKKIKKNRQSISKASQLDEERDYSAEPKFGPKAVEALAMSQSNYHKTLSLVMPFCHAPKSDISIYKIISVNSTSFHDNHKTLT